MKIVGKLRRQRRAAERHWKEVPEGMFDHDPRPKENKPPFKLTHIKPLTPGQVDTMEAWEDGYHLVLTGYPGTGKSFLALYLGLSQVEGRVRIIRSAVPSRDIGFLPGSAVDKAKVFEAPYSAIAAQLYKRADAWEILKQKGLVSFETSSFLRGTTFKDETVIVDECQNMSLQELDTIITRVGENCRIIFCGDINQNDLIKSKYDTSGFPKFLKILDHIDAFDFVDFKEHDIVRSGLVKDYILAKIKEG